MGCAPMTCHPVSSGRIHSGIEVEDAVTSPENGQPPLGVAAPHQYPEVSTGMSLSVTGTLVGPCFQQCIQSNHIAQLADAQQSHV
jgi:hypothetical protein